MLIFCKDNKKADTMRDMNVKMWMKLSFSDRNVSDNEIDKKNRRYTKSGCYIAGKWGGKCISSISDFVVSDFLLLLHVKPYKKSQS